MLVTRMTPSTLCCVWPHRQEVWQYVQQREESDGLRVSHGAPKSVQSDPLPALPPDIMRVVTPLFKHASGNGQGKVFNFILRSQENVWCHF